MSTFSEQLAKIAAEYDGPESEPLPVTPRCSVCHEYRELNDNGLCSRCQADVDRGYAVSAKAGRCANGAERDSGSLYHARMLGEHGPEWVPVCGVAPGRRSAGWSSWRPVGQQVTCKRCLRRLEKAAR